MTPGNPGPAPRAAQQELVIGAHELAVGGDDVDRQHVLAAPPEAP